MDDRDSKTSWADSYIESASNDSAADSAIGREEVTPIRTAYYVFSSHWDREWHEPFEIFRRRLITYFDAVLDAITDRRLHGPVYCDGQSIVLEDYLAVRPERRDWLPLTGAG